MRREGKKLIHETEVITRCVFVGQVRAGRVFFVATGFVCGWWCGVGVICLFVLNGEGFLLVFLGNLGEYAC